MTKPKEDSGLCTHILIKFGYSYQYILPIDEALDMIRSLSRSVKLVTDYDKPARIDNKMDEITIGFMSIDDINQIRVEAHLKS